MASNVADLTRKFHDAATSMPKALDTATTNAAQRTKAIFLAAASGAGLVEGKRMRGVGVKGAAWGVRYTVTGPSGNQTAEVKFTGPVHLVNNDTSPHVIMSRQAKAAKREEGRAVIQALTGKKVRKARQSRKGAGVLALPTHPVASVHHPGTKGKNFFGPANELAKVQATSIVARAPRDAVIRAGFGR